MCIQGTCIQDHKTSGALKEYPGSTAVCVSRVCIQDHITSGAYKVYPGSTVVCVSRVHIFKIVMPIKCIQGLQQYAYPGYIYSRI